MNTSDNKLVSVCIATYNGEKYIQEQIESILKQTYKNVEIIVQDDCSNDNTVAILQEYKDKITLYRNQKNLGYIKNFESLLQKAKGDFIAPCDQDDLWEENKIELLLQHISNYSLVYSNSKLIDEKRNPLNQTLQEKLNNNFISSTTALNFLFDNSVSAHAMIFQRELLEDIKHFPNTLYFDQYIAATAASKKGVFYLDKELVLYRQHSNNTLGNRKKTKTTLVTKIRKKLEKKSQTQERMINILQEFSAITTLKEDEKEKLSALYSYHTRWYHSFCDLEALGFYLKQKDILFAITKKNRTILSCKKSIGYNFYKICPLI